MNNVISVLKRLRQAAKLPNFECAWWIPCLGCVYSFFSLKILFRNNLHFLTKHTELFCKPIFEGENYTLVEYTVCSHYFMAFIYYIITMNNNGLVSSGPNPSHCFSMQSLLWREESWTTRTTRSSFYRVHDPEAGL